MRDPFKLLLPAHGQCRLSVASATSLRLSPYNGQNLNIDGALEQIPSAGVTISNSGLSASTVYFVYAFMNAGVMALELSTTGHSTHTNGVEIKTGNASRTLVGMIRTNASTQFVDDYTSRFCLNWFNRRTLVGASLTTTGSTANTSVLTELNSNARVGFLTWADEGVDAVVVGSASNTAAGNSLHTTSPGVDGAGGAQTQATTYAAAVSVVPIYGRYVFNVAEGYHFASGYGLVSQGTGTWTYGVQVISRG